MKRIWVSKVTILSEPAVPSSAERLHYPPSQTPVAFRLPFPKRKRKRRPKQ